MKLLQSVDDSSRPGEWKNDIINSKTELLNFLGEEGLRISKMKSQFCRKGSEFLGHLISQGDKNKSRKGIQRKEDPTPPNWKRIQKILRAGGVV